MEIRTRESPHHHSPVARSLARLPCLDRSACTHLHDHPSQFVCPVSLLVCLPARACTSVGPSVRSRAFVWSVAAAKSGKGRVVSAANSDYHPTSSPTADRSRTCRTAVAGKHRPNASFIATCARMHCMAIRYCTPRESRSYWS